MKSKTIICSMFAVTTFAVCLCALLTVKGITSIAPDESRNLSLKVAVNKNSFVLGEIIQLKFEVTNNATTPLKTFNPSVEVGNLKVFVSNQNGEMAEYRAAGWGRKRGHQVVLQPKQIYNSQAFVLWKPNSAVSQPLNKEGETVSDNKIDYAIVKAGVYYIKTVLTLGGESPAKIESEPIQIVVNEPVGDDLAVWSRIKNNGEIAYFMQQGKFKSYKKDEIEKLKSEVERLAREYPSGLLSAQINQSLEKLRADERAIEEQRQLIKKNREKKP